jgi:uncharacterized protein (DUF1778 family)
MAHDSPKKLDTEDPGRPPDRTATVTARMPAGQKDLIEKAAAQREWSASNLLRVAGYEKAVHIVNTGQATTFDFRDVARRTADQLCAPRMLYVDEGSGVELAPEGLLRAEPSLVEARERGLVLETHNGDRTCCSPEKISNEDLEAFETAIRLGGLEFVGMLVQECSYRVRTGNLMTPIEPDVR